MRRLRIFALPALTLWFAACSEDRTADGPPNRVTLGQRCAEPSACSVGVCSFGFCRKPCAGEGECGGEICLSDGRQSGCRLPEERSCALSSECGEGLVCAGGSSCKVPCTSSSGCALDSQSCEQGGCTPIGSDAGTTDGGTDGGAIDAGADQSSADGGRLLCDGAPCVPTLLCSRGDNGPLVGTPNGLATDGTFVVANIDGALHGCRLNGTRQPTGYNGIRNPRFDSVTTGYRLGPVEFVVQDGYLYYVEGDAFPPQGVRVSLGIESFEFTVGPNLDGSNSGGPYSLAIADNKLYFTYAERGEIRRANLDGSSLEVLASGEARPTVIASDGVRLVWANDTRPASENCSVITASADGSGRSEITALRGRCAERLRVDENFVYVEYHEPVDSPESKVYRCRADGSELTDLAAPGGLLVLDGPYVYLQAANGVVRMPRGGGPKTLVHEHAGIAIAPTRFYFLNDEGIAFIPAQ